MDFEVTSKLLVQKRNEENACPWRKQITSRTKVQEDRTNFDKGERRFLQAYPLRNQRKSNADQPLVVRSSWAMEGV